VELIGPEAGRVQSGAGFGAATRVCEREARCGVAVRAWVSFRVGSVRVAP
jgi:hypothetical protein